MDVDEARSEDPSSSVDLCTAVSIRRTSTADIRRRASSAVYDSGVADQQVLRAFSFSEVKVDGGTDCSTIPRSSLWSAFATEIACGVLSQRWR
jgi:hypothetical protein